MRDHALITGGAGFIGSHLAEKYLGEGWAVTTLDDLSTGAMQNIAHLERIPQFRHVKGTVTDERTVGELVDEADIVLHLAAAVGVRLVLERPVATIRNNIEGTEVMLRAAAKKRMPFFFCVVERGLRQGNDASLSRGWRSAARADHASALVVCMREGSW